MIPQPGPSPVPAIATRAQRLLLLVGIGLLGACDSPQSVSESALTQPIDFSYACEGTVHTVAPVIDERAADFNATRICADLASGRQGALFGLVLNRFPASVTVSQLNPAQGPRGLIDADFFIPGRTGIATIDDPLRLLRAPDWSHFLVIANGRGLMQRLVVHSFTAGELSYSTAVARLPGAPTDATIVGQQVAVAARDAAELCIFETSVSDDWETTPPAITRIPLPGRAVQLVPFDGDLLVIWRDRPVLTRLRTDGTIVEELGLVPACRNGLDDDGDGLTDMDDPDCLDPDDDDEGVETGAARRPLPPMLGLSFDGVPSCENGIDDDGDGLTDAEDPACAGGDPDGELLPACMNGVDDDGDGLTDMDDPDCAFSEGRSEGPRPKDGPFRATVIDGDPFGRFVYVLDARLGEYLVFSFREGALSRVNVHAEDGVPPELLSVPLSSPEAEPEIRQAPPAIRQPALLRRGHKNVRILSGNAFQIASGRLRGELWERLIPEGSVPREVPAGQWRPPVCAPDSPEGRCAQPALDDATWVVLGAAIDGRIQIVEAIRRGEPVHRLLQLQPDPSRRTHDVTAPRLTLRGRLINARGQPRVGWPLLGPSAQEVLADAVPGESAQRLRRFGIWPATDFEEALTEEWRLTYEGAIPDAGGHVGRFLSEEVFFDANQRFCEHGVQAGDWLQLQIPVLGSDPALIASVTPTLSDGRTCPVIARPHALVELQVTRVGMFELEVDPTSLRARPVLPALDTEAIRAELLPLRLCQQALSAIDDTLQRPENLAPLGPFSPAAVPAFLTYRVRADEAWVAVGKTSGYLHRQRWDRDKSLCVIDDGLDPRLQGRAFEAKEAVASYDQCPPPNDQMSADNIAALVGEAARFTNPSFSLDVLSACETTEEGAIVRVPTQQETSFTFTVTGPHAGSALSVSDSILQARVPVLESRRHQVQLDTSRNRLTILQLRLGDLKEITTLE